MRIIKTQKDFDTLCRESALSAALLDQIEGYFQQLRDELEDEVESEFCLESHGYIVVLEVRDNVRDLGNVSLSREDGGLLGIRPEYVEMLDLGERLQAYKIAVLSQKINKKGLLEAIFTATRKHFHQSNTLVIL